MKRLFVWTIVTVVAFGSVGLLGRMFIPYILPQTGNGLEQEFMEEMNAISVTYGRELQHTKDSEAWRNARRKEINNLYIKYGKSPPSWNKLKELHDN